MNPPVGGGARRGGMKRTRALRRSPLDVDISSLDGVKPLRRRNKSLLKEEAADIFGKGDNGTDVLRTIPVAVSRKIIAEARRQAAESDDDENPKGKVNSKNLLRRGSESLEEEQSQVLMDILGGAEADSDEEKDLAQFLSSSKMQRDMPPSDSNALRSRLVDGIIGKLRETDASTTSDATATHRVASTEMPLEAVQAFKAIGSFMAKYRSGKLPKPFRIIPGLVHWEEALFHTDPYNWSPNALKAATRLFSSNLNPRMAQRYYNLILLPAFRSNLASNKRLNPHIYEAMMKAMFKPNAWFKGILLPLAQEECTYLEAVIISSILRRVSVPPLPAAAALVRLGQMEPWFGTTSILMTTLIDKKFALPAPAVDSLVRHFCRFKSEAGPLPLVWHRCLLTFAQRYKDGLEETRHKLILRELLSVHRHHAVGAEIHRELFDTSTLTPAAAKIALKVAASQQQHDELML